MQLTSTPSMNFKSLICTPSTMAKVPYISNENLNAIVDAKHQLANTKKWDVILNYDEEQGFQHASIRKDKKQAFVNGFNPVNQMNNEVTVMATQTIPSWNVKERVVKFANSEKAKEAYNKIAEGYMYGQEPRTFKDDLNKEVNAALFMDMSEQ